MHAGCDRLLVLSDATHSELCSSSMNQISGPADQWKSWIDSPTSAGSSSAIAEV